MRKRILQFALMGAAATMLFACEKKVAVADETPETVDKDKVRTEIQQLETAYATGMEGKDIEAIMAYYADDVISIEGGEEPVKGKENLKKTIAAQFENLPPKFKVTMKTDDILVSSDGNLVTETGTFSMKDTTNTKDFAKGNFLAVFEKRDGKYQCVREAVSSLTKKDKQ